MSEIVAVLEYNGVPYLVHQAWSHPDEDADEEESASLAWYMWVQGNYSCDCNRMAFIADEYADFPVTAREDDYPDYPCGGTVKLVSLHLDGKDLLAPTPRERLAAIGLIGL